MLLTEVTRFARYLSVIRWRRAGFQEEVPVYSRSRYTVFRPEGFRIVGFFAEPAGRIHDIAFVFSSRNLALMPSTMSRISVR